MTCIVLLVRESPAGAREEARLVLASGAGQRRRANQPRGVAVSGKRGQRLEYQWMHEGGDDETLWILHRSSVT